MENFDDFEKLAKLRDRNILNEEEYVGLKQALIRKNTEEAGGAKSVCTGLGNYGDLFD